MSVKNSQSVFIKTNDNFSGVKIIKKDLVNKKLYEKDKNDSLERTLIRHNPIKLTTIIKKYADFKNKFK